MLPMQGLIDSLENDLRYAIEVEGKWQLDDAANYEEVKDAIKTALESLRDHHNREETPLIYHLDVAAMYPNIILTNRSAKSFSSNAAAHFTALSLAKLYCLL